MTDSAASSALDTSRSAVDELLAAVHEVFSDQGSSMCWKAFLLPSSVEITNTCERLSIALCELQEAKKAGSSEQPDDRMLQLKAECRRLLDKLDECI
ncbi:hypothetical protein FDECE_1042 [Fusarium decemcellulare]|nr:hypothetical protein FDECE_1042 [Fusarium decemcellulare]